MNLRTEKTDMNPLLCTYLLPCMKIRHGMFWQKFGTVNCKNNLHFSEIYKLMAHERQLCLCRCGQFAFMRVLTPKQTILFVILSLIETTGTYTIVLHRRHRLKFTNCRVTHNDVVFYYHTPSSIPNYHAFRTYTSGSLFSSFMSFT